MSWKAPLIMHQDRLRWRMKRGYIPYRRCLTILGIRQSDFYGYIKAGKIPPPEHTPECYYYTVEQLNCLIQARFYATIEHNGYSIFLLKRMADYVSKYWPPGEEDEQVKAGKKAGKWRRRSHNS